MERRRHLVAEGAAELEGKVGMGATAELPMVVEAKAAAARSHVPARAAVAEAVASEAAAKAEREGEAGVVWAAGPMAAAWAGLLVEWAEAT